MFKFILLSICGQYVLVFVAYKFEDIAPRDDFLSMKKPGCVPHYPEVGDVVMVRPLEWRQD